MAEFQKYKTKFKKKTTTRRGSQFVLFLCCYYFTISEWISMILIFDGKSITSVVLPFKYEENIALLKVNKILISVYLF